MNAKLYKIIYDIIEDTLPDGGFIIQWFLDYQDFDYPVPGYEAVKVMDGDYNQIFVIYMGNYWNTEELFGRYKEKKSPILHFENNFRIKFDSLFSEDIWHLPVKDWIKNNFPELNEIKIKTVEGYSQRVGD